MEKTLGVVAVNVANGLMCVVAIDQEGWGAARIEQWNTL